MKGRGAVLLVAIVAWVCGAQSAELGQLKIVLVGSNKERVADYAAFLRKHFANLELADRKSFDPARASAFDVVLLDWQQNEGGQRDFPPTKSPLGERDKWSKPTVFLGSAGLHMAVVWKLKGGSG